MRSQSPNVINARVLFLTILATTVSLFLTFNILTLSFFNPNSTNKSYGNFYFYNIAPTNNAQTCTCMCIRAGPARNL